MFFFLTTVALAQSPGLETVNPEPGQELGALTDFLSAQRNSLHIPGDRPTKTRTVHKKIHPPVTVRPIKVVLPPPFPRWQPGKKHR